MACINNTCLGGYQPVSVRHFGARDVCVSRQGVLSSWNALCFLYKMVFHNELIVLLATILAVAVVHCLPFFQSRKQFLFFRFRFKFPPPPFYYIHSRRHYVVQYQTYFWNRIFSASWNLPVFYTVSFYYSFSFSFALLNTCVESENVSSILRFYGTFSSAHFSVFVIG